MNRVKIVIAGLVAGLVLNVLDFVSYSYVVGGAMKRALDVVNPSLMAAMTTSRAMATGIVLDFLFGVVIVWLYAALRPRYGAGPRNALMAGFFIWLVSAFGYSMYHTMGMMGMPLWLLMSAIALFNFCVAALVGGMLYSE
jgi:hypothetical protein